MKSKTNRHIFIKRCILENKLSSQEGLLKLLKKAGFNLTQATLSRDLKELRVGRVADPVKGSIYILNEQLKQPIQKDTSPAIPVNSIVSVVYSYNLLVIKTFPAFASTVATYIDKSQLTEIAGTVAGDDTILVAPREGYAPGDILKALIPVIPGIDKKLE